MIVQGMVLADRYELIRRIGGSNAAPVWRANDRHDQANVVLKFPAAGPQAAAEMAAYRAIALLSHPALARALELHEDDPAFVVLAWAASGDLSGRRGQGHHNFLGPVQSVAQALSLLHETGWIHGDVKASNVLLDASGQALLTDFQNLKRIGAERAGTEPRSPFTSSPQQCDAQPAAIGDDVYSFGAMVLELLAGQPAPPALVELARRCMAGEALDRPVSMRQVSDDLQQIEAMEMAPRALAPLLTPPSASVDSLRASWQRTTAVAIPDARQLRRQGFRHGLLVAAAAGLALVALLLFVVPTERTPALAVKVPVPAATPAAAVAETPKDLAAPAAVNSETEALRRSALADSLRRGRSALEQKDAEAASAAFAAALKIDASSEAARQGARRAATLESVLAELSRARVLEQEGKTDAAVAAYRKALSLDAQTTTAQAALARLSAQQSADRFGQAMAQGYAAIREHRAAVARAALAQAEKIRPGDAEISRALAQLAVDETATQINLALSAARIAMVAERWQEAVDHYQTALQIDGTLGEAQQSLRTATARAQLNRALEALIAQPERSYTAASYQAAHEILQQATAIPAAGPLLLQQIGKVAQILRVAETPLDVVLRSDNLTLVTIYRVGELGTFSERSVQLKPGRYVAVGTRLGFRDVRQELNVLPGVAREPLLIQCHEQL